MEVQTNRTETDPTFLSRYFLDNDEVYSEKRYLTVIMRTSAFEKIFTKYLFQSTSSEFSLYNFLENLKGNKKELEKFKARLNLIIKSFPDEGPLYIFSEISKEIQRLLGEDFTQIKYDKFILKMEFFLAWHIENNFYEKQIDQKMNLNFYDNMYLQKERTNFNYSIECLNTMYKFLKVFEKQSLTTRIENDFENNVDLFCTEKIYYFYCDKLNKDKNQIGNIVEYLIRQLLKKLETLKNAKVNNVQIENYILRNLFIINKIIQEYSFYFTKKPEFETIFGSLKTLKAWPVPVGNLCNDLLEVIINESTFQGISMINRLRETYFIDLLSQRVSKIQTKYFRTTVLIYSNEWDMRHYATINTENPSGFNLVKFLDRIKSKQKKKRSCVFNLKEFVIRIFLTIIFNSKQLYNDDTLKQIYDQFYPEISNEEDNEEEQEEGEEEEEEEKEEKEENEVTEGEEETSKKKKEKKTENYTNTKKSLDMILKLIDVGFDKTIEDFDKEINIIANKLIKTSSSTKTEEGNNLLINDYLLPVTAMRNYLKPDYTDLCKMFGNIKENGCLGIFEIYKRNFQYVVKNYFPHLLMVSEDPMVEQNLKSLREKLYLNYRINLVLVEEGRVMNDFIENMIYNSKDTVVNKITPEEYESFWKFFVNSKEEIESKFLLHIVPHFENYSQNPFRLLNEGEVIDNDVCLLSEFLATNDNIYKNVVFMPWASKCDSTFYSYIPNCQHSNENVMQFPSLDVMYSFLKKPLDYYIGDSRGLLNLNLYQISVNDRDQTNKVFYKNIEITLKEPSKTKITMQCVDYLGLEYKDDKKIELNLTAPFQLRIFNLFFKKNVPFNYNMTSNNGWLEVFICDKYNKEEVDKICTYNSFIKNNNDGKFYEEFNVPQMDLETLFRNYKVKYMTIESNKPYFEIKCDDTEKFIINEGPTVGKNGPEYKITIEDYLRNGKKVTIPIATFVSI